MAAREIVSGVYALQSIDWDRRLFDELIPLPDGTSYNSYLIKDNKVALIDSTDPSMSETLFSNLDQITNRVDYVIANHAEQDHSGTISEVIKRYPDSKIVTNAKCQTLLEDLLLIPQERFITINDGDTLSLGTKTLEFIFYPWVHWPETMLTYLSADGILFTCDLFGSHLATSQLFADETVLIPAKRYYAEIMMPFRTTIRGNMNKITSKNIRFIAPSHGPLYNRPELIMNAYKEWLSDETKNEVIIAYVSMHDSTRAMVNYAVERFMELGINVHVFNLTKTDIGELAMRLVDAKVLLLASPTVLGGLHPVMASAAFIVNALRPKTKYVALMGSYGWGGRAPEQAVELLKNLGGEVLKPVLIKGHPSKNNFIEIRELVNQIAEKLSSS